MAKEKKQPEDLPKPTAASGSLADLLPDLGGPPPAAQQDVVHDEVPPGQDTALKLGFIGCGQAGGRLAHAFWSLGYRRVAVINTTAQDFEGLHPDVHKLDLAISGSFKEPAIAAKEIASREEEVWDLLHRSMGGQLDGLLVCAGLGGGTGTGLSPYVLKVAREYMREVNPQGLAGGLFSLPQRTEGRKVVDNASKGLAEILRLGPAPLFLIDNSQVYEMQNRPGIGQMHGRSNSLVAQTIHQFNVLAARRSPLVTFDRSEFVDVLRQGLVVLAAGASREICTQPGGLSTAVTDILAQQCFCRLPLAGATRAACVFMAHDRLLNDLSVDFFDAAFAKVERTLGQSADAVVHRGIYTADLPEHDQRVLCFVMISGLTVPPALLENLSKGTITPSKAQFFGIEG